MNEQSAHAIATIAALAALADGESDEQERARVTETAARLGIGTEEIVLVDGSSAAVAAAQVARRLSTSAAREAAYQVALDVVHADGYANTKETMFLRSLAHSLDVDPTRFDAASASAVGAVDQWINAESGEASNAQSFAAGAPAGGSQAAGAQQSGATAQSIDAFILDQAMLTAALELLPDRLANLGILPLQLRLVHTIGQRSGQSADGPHVKELVATLGIGVAAQVMESVVRKTFGGLAGTLFGGALGGAAGLAAGGAVTFATTYALGHAALQYYAQGRTMSTAELKTLFSTLKNDGAAMYPRVQSRVAELTRGNTLQSIMQSVRGV